MKKMNDIIDLLHNSGCSCVVANNKKIRTFNSRGVKDLYDLLNTDAGFLKGASVADKVVGKAAASLMILGGIGELYTDLISTPALRMLKNNGIKTSFGMEVPVILNRNQSDWCPLEIICHQGDSPKDFFPSIEKFIKDMTSSKESGTI